MIFSSTFSTRFLETVEYYPSIDRGLARRFVEAVDEAVREIMRFSTIGRRSASYRLFHFRGFQFSVFYIQSTVEELVAVVLHHHKPEEPGIKQ